MNLSFKELHLIRNEDGTYYATIVSDIICGTINTEVPRMRIDELKVTAMTTPEVDLKIND